MGQRISSAGVGRARQGKAFHFKSLDGILAMQESISKQWTAQATGTALGGGAG
jgi:hypothetical protein